MAAMLVLTYARVASLAPPKLLVRALTLTRAAQTGLEACLAVGVLPVVTLGPQLDDFGVCGTQPREQALDDLVGDRAAELHQPLSVRPGSPHISKSPDHPSRLPAEDVSTLAFSHLRSPCHVHRSGRPGGHGTAGL